MARIIYDTENRDTSLVNVRVILMSVYKDKASCLFKGLPEHDNILNITPDKYGFYYEVFEVVNDCIPFKVFNLNTDKRPAYKEYEKLMEFIKEYENSNLELLIVIS